MILMDLKTDIGDIKTAILVARLDSDSSEGSECVYLAYFDEKTSFFEGLLWLEDKVIY